MRRKRDANILAAALLGILPAMGVGTETAGERVPAGIERSHHRLSKQLSPEQAKAVSAVYPGFQVVKVCSGSFSGAGSGELVLGVWKPVEAKDWWKSEVHRVGLIGKGTGWEAHIIDDEIEKDEKMSRSSPMRWQYAIGKKGFSGDMKCGVELGKDPDLTDALGDKPFFDLKEKGLQKNMVVCFPTSDTYNNWDCLVYSPKDGRFRLWYQQAHAD